MGSVKKGFGVFAMWLLMSLFAFTSFASNGNWMLDSMTGGWYYVQADGQRVKSCWKEIDNAWYYFGDDSFAYMNRYTPDGYFVDEFGAWDGKEAVQNIAPAVTEESSGPAAEVAVWKWVYSNGDWYYQDSSTGRYWTGWVYTDNYWYCLGEDGKMLTGLIDINENGKMVTYYFNDGKSVEMSGKPYGAMAADMSLRLNWEIFKLYRESQGVNNMSANLVEKYVMTFDGNGRMESFNYCE